VSDVTAKVASLAAGIEGIRRDVPAIEWRTGQLLAKLAELTAIVAELAGTKSAEEPARTEREIHDKATRRKATIEHLLWLACRSLTPGVADEARDQEVRRVLASWGVTKFELKLLGYGDE
jgi:hypothetical protein